MEKPKRQITVAALAALADGDIDNFERASTVGGIEAQEAAGQQMLCATDILPKTMDPDRQTYESLGFVFGPDEDDLFLKATLPPGWKKQATDHSMWSTILDDSGTARVSVFYKAAFYDRKAFMRLTA